MALSRKSCKRASGSVSEDSGGHCEVSPLRPPRVMSSFPLEERPLAGSAPSVPQQVHDIPLCGDAEPEKNAKNRGSYRCSRCNMPKKGHVCPYQPRFRKKDPSECRDAESQAEIDPANTVAALGPLQLQGLPQSYVVRMEAESSHIA